MSYRFRLDGELLDLGPDTSEQRHARRCALIAVMREHPDVWEMHKRNEQFTEIDGVTGRPAVLHCAVQALRARVLAWLLKLDPATAHLLEKAAFLHDSYKANERRYMLKHGCDWDSYDRAQVLARRSWEESGMFGSLVMDIAGAVGHESLAIMESRVRAGADNPGAYLTPRELAMLAMHYLDDISIGSDWVTPVVDGRNALDFRMERNESSPVYATLNEEGRTRLSEQARQAGLTSDDFLGGKTTYEAQRLTGHRVEQVLATVVAERQNVPQFPVLHLPVIIDNVLRERLRIISPSAA